MNNTLQIGPPRGTGQCFLSFISLAVKENENAHSLFTSTSSTAVQSDNGFGNKRFNKYKNKLASIKEDEICDDNVFEETFQNRARGSDDYTFLSEYTDSMKYFRTGNISSSSDPMLLNDNYKQNHLNASLNNWATPLIEAPCWESGSSSFQHHNEEKGRKSSNDMLLNDNIFSSSEFICDDSDEWVDNDCQSWHHFAGNQSGSVEPVWTDKEWGDWLGTNATVHLSLSGFQKDDSQSGYSAGAVNTDHYCGNYDGVLASSTPWTQLEDAPWYRRGRASGELKPSSTKQSYWEVSEPPMSSQFW